MKIEKIRGRITSVDVRKLQVMRLKGEWARQGTHPPAAAKLDVQEFAA
ncbi:MAG: hypothetical protein NTX27_03860 [Verrucomicrobia bacterium]|nr:hypothetical protein [Verrucomicrobiota bacterium]